MLHSIIKGEIEEKINWLVIETVAERQGNGSVDTENKVEKDGYHVDCYHS